MIDAAKIEELRGLLTKATNAAAHYCAVKGANARGPEFYEMERARDAYYRSLIAAAPALLDLSASLARDGEDGELCKRLRYNASIWQRKADDDHPLVKDQLDAANAIDRLAYQAQGHCRDAKHAESVADELRRLLEKEKERADKFMWQVRDTCARAEKAEARIRALASEKERLALELRSRRHPHRQGEAQSINSIPNQLSL